MNLEDWPSLRLVIPLIAGIIISDTILNTRAQVPVWCILALTTVLIILIFIFSDSKPRLSGMLLSLSFALAGAFSYQREIQRVSVDWPERWVIYHGVINTYPLERERTYRLEVTLNDSLYRDLNIYLYLPKDSLAMSLEPGQNITFDGKINKPSSEGAGFDYASYLLSHGISGTLRVQAKDWHSDPPQGRLSLKIRSVRFRKNIIRKYREWGLEGNALAVASAVSLGEKKQIDENLREIYSTSGVSHVLAVSGLHVGIICWFLYIIFPSFIFRKQMWIREIIVLGILWAYAFAIGLPVSITRSLIMFSIVAICRGIDKENSALNSLGIAALLMLAVNPSALFDMSFQLSFSAVLFIVVLTPLLLDFYKPLTAPGRYVWRVSVLSFSAQIGTTPIIMYHFSGFSTYVLLANLFVVPAMFVVVALSMSLWIIGWIPIIRVPVVNVLTWMIDTLTRMQTFVSSLPYAHVELSLSNWWNILIIYAVVLFIFLWIKEKRTHRLVQALACVAFSSVLALIQTLLFE